MNSRDETPYLRPPGYAERYRDLRFRSGSGAATDRRERRALRRLLADAPLRPGTWLDLPSGAGRLSHLLPGAVVQVDRSKAMLDAIEAPAGARICAAAQALPFADDQFAGALCHRLMQHVPHADERIRILGELRRVTDGPIIVSFFHAVCLQHARRVVSRRLRRKPVSGRGAISLRRFLGELQAAGLRATGCAGLSPFVSEQWLVRAERATPPSLSARRRPS